MPDHAGDGAERHDPDERGVVVVLVPEAAVDFVVDDLTVVVHVVVAVGVVVAPHLAVGVVGGHDLGHVHDGGGRVGQHAAGDLHIGLGSGGERAGQHVPGHVRFDFAPVGVGEGEAFRNVVDDLDVGGGHVALVEDCDRVGHEAAGQHGVGADEGLAQGEVEDLDVDVGGVVVVLVAPLVVDGVVGDRAVVLGIAVAHRVAVLARTPVGVAGGEDLPDVGQVAADPVADGGGEGHGDTGAGRERSGDGGEDGVVHTDLPGRVAEEEARGEVVDQLDVGGRDVALVVDGEAEDDVAAGAVGAGGLHRLDHGEVEDLNEDPRDVVVVLVAVLVVDGVVGDGAVVVGRVVEVAVRVLARGAVAIFGGGDLGDVLQCAGGGGRHAEGRIDGGAAAGGDGAGQEDGGAATAEVGPGVVLQGQAGREGVDHGDVAGLVVALVVHGDPEDDLASRLMDRGKRALAQGEVEDAGQIDEAGVDVRIELAAVERDGRGDPIRVDIAVEVRAADAGRGETESARRHHLDAVGAGGQSRELIATVIVGDGGADHFALRVEQADGDAGHAGLVHVLDAVAIDIVPDRVAEAGGLEQASIDGGVVFPAFEVDEAAAAAGRADVAVEAVVAADVGRDERVAGGWYDFDHVVAGREEVEEVSAVRVGDRGGDPITRQVVQAHGDAGHTGFRRTLDTVPVGVEPDRVAERGGLEDPGVDGAVVLTGCQ